LLAQGIEIAAFTLVDRQRTRQLVDWGVAAIISDDLALLRSLKVPA